MATLTITCPDDGQAIPATVGGEPAADRFIVTVTIAPHDMAAHLAAFH